MKILNNLRFLPRIISNKKRTPLYIIFFVTSRCNMRCSHCFFWKELNKQLELSLKNIDQISKTLDPLLFLRITGGEPFLRQDIPEIVGLFYKNTKLRNLGINTNGFFTNRIVNDIKKILSKYNLTLDICISIDDLEKQHDENRKIKGAFDNAARTVRELNKLKKEYKNLTVTVGLTVTAENQFRLKRIFKEIKSFEPDFISGNLIRGSPMKPELKEVNISNYLQFISQINKYNQSKSHNFYLNAPLKDKMLSNLIKDTLLTKRYQGIKCVASDKMAVLYSNGDIYPCESLDKKIGNLVDFNFNFRKAWESKKRIAIQSEIVKNKCFCTHECFLSSNILLNPNGLLKSIKYLTK